MKRKRKRKKKRKKNNLEKFLKIIKKNKEKEKKYPLSFSAKIYIKLILSINSTFILKIINILIEWINNKAKRWKASCWGLLIKR